MFSSPCHASLSRTRCSLRWVVAAVCAAALFACGSSEDSPPEQDTALETDAIETDAIETDAIEADAIEADAIEADATEADATTDTDAEADTTEADATEADTTEADATEADATEDADETDATETDAATDTGGPGDVSTDTSDTPALCGNGEVEDGEACDDGTNLGAAVGDCVPGCSGRVQQVLRLVLSTSLGGVDSNFAAEASSFIEAADALCPEGYKAVITDGATRLASVTPRAGDGQVDWVLYPFTAYYDEIPNEAFWPGCCAEDFAGDSCCEDGVYVSQHMWTTDDVALLGLRDGEAVNLPGPTSIPYYWLFQSGRPVWTGFNADWTAGETCSGWTSTSSEESGVIGNSQYRDARLWSITTNACGSVMRQLLCAEQPAP